MNKTPLERFLKYSSMVSNEHIFLKESQINSYLKETRFNYINIPSLNLFRDCVIDENGIESAIVEAEAGISETGTVVVMSEDEKLRLATCLCEELTVILYTDKIFNNLEDIAPILEANMRKESNYIAFITGASRTADIERVLTIGVHGPVRMKVILTERGE
ncbi:LUD domain-containing protein [Calditerrivibrio sp.]|uniref:LUD domain-containing protein n=1 Tax=Calditerrivibrio sp. TaxID=2792612 RepID=UPI003D11FC21